MAKLRITATNKTTFEIDLPENWKRMDAVERVKFQEKALRKYRRTPLTAKRQNGFYAHADEIVLKPRIVTT